MYVTPLSSGVCNTTMHVVPRDGKTVPLVLVVVKGLRKYYGMYHGVDIVTDILRTY